MLPENRPQHDVAWPRAVQTSVAILGALAFGALAYGYGYGVSGGRAESYPQRAAVKGPADTLFFSDWGTTGTTVAAVTDNSVWNFSSNVPDSAAREVVAVAEAPGSWPDGLANVLRAGLSTATTVRIAYNNLSTLGVPATRYWRWYQNETHVYPLSPDNVVHMLGIRDAGGDAPFDIDHTFLADDATYDWAWKPGQGIGSAQPYHTYSTQLDKGTTYRIELKVSTLGTTGDTTWLDVDARIYDETISTIEPQFVASDLTCTRGNHNGLSAHTMADMQILSYSGANAGILTSMIGETASFKITNPGETGTGSLYLGSFLVSSDTWGGVH